MATRPPAVVRTDSPSYQAFQILRFAFTVAPILAGIDKFLHILVDWDKYLAPIVPQVLHVAPHTFMLVVGVIEVVAGVLVAAMPALGAPIVAAWLCGIIVNLLLIPGYYDVALRDLGLALGAAALTRLAQEFAPRRVG
jgi:uncharacterized membrane protein YphA (DoxX/SURF4 family)